MYCKEDYRYEICGENGEILETDYVALDTAIEYALENGGYIINKIWFPVDEYGNIAYGSEIIGAEIAWLRKFEMLETEK